MRRLAFSLSLVVPLSAAIPGLLGCEQAGAEVQAPDAAVGVTAWAIESAADAVPTAPVRLPDALFPNEGRLGADASLYSGEGELEAIVYPGRFLLVARGEDDRFAVLRFTLEDANPRGRVVGAAPRVSADASAGFGAALFQRPWPEMALTVALEGDAVRLSATGGGTGDSVRRELAVLGARRMEAADDGSLSLETAAGVLRLLPGDGLRLAVLEPGRVGLEPVEGLAVAQN